MGARACTQVAFGPAAGATTAAADASQDGTGEKALWCRLMLVLEPIDGSGTMEWIWAGAGRWKPKAEEADEFGERQMFIGR